MIGHQHSTTDVIVTYLEGGGKLPRCWLTLKTVKKSGPILSNSTIIVRNFLTDTSYTYYIHLSLSSFSVCLSLSNHRATSHSADLATADMY